MTPIITETTKPTTIFLLYFVKDSSCSATILPSTIKMKAEKNEFVGFKYSDKQSKPDKSNVCDNDG